MMDEVAEQLGLRIVKPVGVLLAIGVVLGALAINRFRRDDVKNFFV